MTKKYDESEERLKKKEKNSKNAVEKNGIPMKNQHQNHMLLIAKNLSSRTIVDFEKGEVTIEVIVDEEDPQYDSYELKYNYDFDNLFSNKDIIHNKFFLLILDY